MRNFWQQVKKEKQLETPLPPEQMGSKFRLPQKKISVEKKKKKKGFPVTLQKIHITFPDMIIKGVSIGDEHLVIAEKITSIKY